MVAAAGPDFMPGAFSVPWPQCHLSRQQQQRWWGMDVSESYIAPATGRRRRVAVIRCVVHTACLSPEGLGPYALGQPG